MQILSEKKTNFTLNKKKKTVATILILLMSSVMLMAMPVPIQAQTAYTNMQDGGSIPLPAGVTPDLTLDSIAVMSFRPNPIGVGQPLLVNLWLHPTIHVSHYFKGYTATLTKPDGTIDTKVVDSYRADSTAWFEYTVDQIGTWKIKFDFPGGYFPAGNYTAEANPFAGAGVTRFPQSVYYRPSSDGPYNFTVQQDMVSSWPPSQLPTDYWTRPISPENREWWSIAGYYPGTGVVGGGPNWPADTNTYMSNYLYTPYVQAPNSAHVVWKREGATGGLMGGPMGQESWTSGGGTPSIIFSGKCYQTVTKVFDGVTQSVWQCYDLRTGEVYWEKTNVPAATFVTFELGAGSAVPGAVPTAGAGRTMYLGTISGGRLLKYNPANGAVIQNISLSPLTTGTFYTNLDFAYFLTVQDLGASAGANRYRLINWTAHGDLGPSNQQVNLTMRVMNNITWPFSSLGTVDYEAGIAVTTYSITSPATLMAKDMGIQSASLKTGQLLWNISSGVGLPLFSGSTAVADHGKFAVRFDDGYVYCWDLNSGKQLWKSELTSWPWGTFGCYGVQSYGGLIIGNQYDGVAAFNWTNGKIAWFFQSKAPYPYETVYQDNYPWFTGISQIADGKLFAFTTEHTPTQPITRGWRLFCINITTGKGIWNITGSIAPGGIADGYLTGDNSYDGYMYVFGKGKSATTVTASPKTIANGAQILIEGTALDQSPAQPSTPCVSKDSMTTQMEYLHMQHPIDGLNHNVTMTGVPITLTAIDSNGNVVNIGKTSTSAHYGTFEMAWTPPAEGTYKIIASFAGDDSYGSSAATTAIAVSTAPVITPTPTSTPTIQTPTEIYFAVSTLAIIIAITIVGLLMLRKRP
jgi:hypothetical protein